MALTVTNMRNFTGYLQMNTVKINHFLDTISDPNTSSAEKIACKTKIKVCIKDIVRMMQTVAEKEGYTITVSRYTDDELRTMKLM